MKRFCVAARVLAADLGHLEIEVTIDDPGTLNRQQVCSEVVSAHERL